MAANRSSVDKFIRLEEHDERKGSAISGRRSGGVAVEVRRDSRIRGDNILIFAITHAARCEFASRIRANTSYICIESIIYFINTHLHITRVSRLRNRARA